MVHPYLKAVLNILQIDLAHEATSLCEMKNKVTEYWSFVNYYYEHYRDEKIIKINNGYFTK